MHIIIVSPEAVPYIKTGGLADVTGNFFKELKNRGQSVIMFLPYYRGIRYSFRPPRIASGLRVHMGNLTYYFDLYSLKDVYFIANDYFFNRDGLYGDRRGDFPDNAERFAFFCMAILVSIKYLKISPEIFHLHDWQTGLLPLYQREEHPDLLNSKTIFTIHNIGYQGLFSPDVLPRIGIHKKFFSFEHLEFFGKVSLLKSGIVNSDMITTVSPTYAKEIMTPEYGFGFDGVLSRRNVTGILNGIDYSIWNPEIDAQIKKNYDNDNLKGRSLCKEDLCKDLDISKPSRPLIGVIGRLTTQKGSDILVECIHDIATLGANMVILGEGIREIEIKLKNVVSLYPNRIILKTGFNDSLARKIYAGSDMFLMPSRYEPCGLAQMIAMRYGSIPIVRKTGGLADTVQDFNPSHKEGTGFVFMYPEKYSMIECIKRALCVYENNVDWRRLVKNAMSRRFTWAVSLDRYLLLYSSLVKG